MTITHEIEINVNGLEDYLDVEFSGDPYMEDDSFDHEFGTQHCTPYPDIEIIEWDKALYTEEQNKAIREYLDDEKRSKRLQELFCREFMEVDY